MQKLGETDLVAVGVKLQLHVCAVDRKKPDRMPSRALSVCLCLPLAKPLPLISLLPSSHSILLLLFYPSPFSSPSWSSFHPPYQSTCLSFCFCLSPLYVFLFHLLFLSSTHPLPYYFQFFFLFLHSPY